MSHAAFKGNLRNELHDAKQKQTIITDGPKSHGGLEETYSPVELLADTYASCAITIMAAVAGQLGCDLTGTYADTETSVDEKEFRIAHIGVHFHMPKSLDESHRSAIEASTRDMCIVGRRLHPDIKKDLTFTYDA